jgi:type II secretory pathway pseudopilin PulG
MSNLYELYAESILFKVPIAALANPYQSAWLNARQKLDDEQLHTIFVVHPEKNILYCMAIPSKKLKADWLNENIELLSYLPGQSGYKGDGLYRLNLGSRAVVLSLSGSNVDLIVNDTTVIDDWIEELDENIFVYDVSGENIESIYQFKANSYEVAYFIDQLINKLSQVFAILIVVFVSIFLLGEWFSHSVSANIAANLEARAKALENAQDQLLTQSLLPAQIAHLQEISSAVIKAGGWIEQYELNEKGEGFKIVLPSWVSRDYLDALGKNVRTTKGNDEMYITLTSGDIK